MAGSAETGVRHLFGNTSGWRRAEGVGRCASAAMKGAGTGVCLGGIEGGRDRGAPWKPVALEGGRATELFYRVGRGPERGR